jgi:hypothetical protein
VYSDAVRLLVRACLLPLALLLFAAPAANAYTPLGAAQVVTELNELRAEHGFSTGVVENPVLSAACDAHNRWMELNDLILHGETPGTPGYSAAGDEAGKRSILAKGSSWSEGVPWLNAPIHMADLLMPGMVETGSSEEHGHSCLTTHTLTNLHAPQPATTTFLAYPRSGGTMPSSQAAFEAPAPPQTFGVRPIRNLVPTGPNLVTFLRGPQFATSLPLLSAARMTGPGGALVPTMTVNERQLPYLPTGAGVIVPRVPLVPGTTYTWTATYSAPPAAGRAAFSYTSAPRTFTTTSQQLCGIGLGGWYATPCPASIVRASTPRSISIATAALGIRAGVTLDGTGWAGATLRAGTRAIATATTTVGETHVGTITLRPGATSLRTLLGRRRSIVLFVELKASSTYVRRVPIIVTR